MTELYLITGFLGAGKTTFLKQLLPVFAGKRLHLIINEFGREGVDGALLKELGAGLDEICNGSIFCACRLDQFEAALETALQSDPEILLVETSGLTDPTNVRRVLAQQSGIAYKGSICLADALRLHKVIETAQPCRRQLAVSSLVLLNKTDLASPEQREAAKELILSANPAAHIEETVFGRVDPAWLRYVTPDVELGDVLNTPDITLQKKLIEISPGMPKAQLEKCLKQLSEDTWRIKGFVTLPEGVFQADGTGPEVKLLPWDGEANNKIVLLAGKGMALRAAVKNAVKWYDESIREIKE